jgi:hypothetical protein
MSEWLRHVIGARYRGGGLSHFSGVQIEGGIEATVLSAKRRR